MSGHVVGAFVVVTEVGVAIGNEFGEKSFEIPAHLGLGVFANDQRRAGMMNEDVAKPSNDPGGLNDRLNLAADLGGPATRCLDDEGLVVEHLGNPLP